MYPFLAPYADECCAAETRAAQCPTSDFGLYCGQLVERERSALSGQNKNR